MNNFEKFDEGLVHNIYISEENLDRIYKIVKDSFPDFNKIEHFKLERNVLNLLRSNNLPAVKVIDIIEKNNKFILVEEKINEGYQKNKGKLNGEEIFSLLIMLKKVHLIELNFYGFIDYNLKGQFSSWELFLNYLLDDSYSYIKENMNFEINESIYSYLKNNLKELNYVGKGKMIITDLNPLNFFFEDNKIIKIIDIDHPISGDPLYEFAAIKWYHEDIFVFYQEQNNLDKLTLFKITLYEMIHGYSILVWMHKHNLLIGAELKKLEHLFNEMKILIKN